MTHCVQLQGYYLMFTTYKNHILLKCVHPLTYNAKNASTDIFFKSPTNKGRGRLKLLSANPLFTTGRLHWMLFLTQPPQESPPGIKLGIFCVVRQMCKPLHSASTNKGTGSNSRKIHRKRTNNNAFNVGMAGHPHV